MIVYNHMQDWIYASKELTALSKLLLERMISLSKDGKSTIYIPRKQYAEQLGVDESSLTRSFKQLQEQGFIVPVKNPNPFSKIRNFKISSKALSAQNATLDSCKMQRSDMANYNDASLQNATLGHGKVQFSSIDRNIDKKIDKKREGAPPDFDFDFVFDSLKKLSEELLTVRPEIAQLDLQEEARSFVIKNKPTSEPIEQRLRAWLDSACKYNKTHRNRPAKTARTAEPVSEDKKMAARRIELRAKARKGTITSQEQQELQRITSRQMIDVAVEVEDVSNDAPTSKTEMAGAV